MNYTKYSASGNDFIIFHTFIKEDRSDLAIKLCDRFNGIGADGLVVLTPHSKYDFEWEFYNSDGSLANMCGNASRAVAHYSYINSLSSNTPTFLTGAGLISAIVDNNIVKTQLTKPVELKPQFNELGYDWFFVDTGVPHLVTIVEDLKLFDIKKAKELRYKYNTNVNFIKIKDQNIYIRTYERGVESETLACGTGMAAGFLFAYQLDLVSDSCFVYPKSKEQLTLSIKDHRLYFKGEVSRVFDTTIL